MGSALNSVVVTLILFVISSEVGWQLGRSGIPYGIGKLATHIILFLLILSGVIASVYKLHEAMQDKFYSTISLYVTGLTLLINLTTGAMLIIKKANPKLASVHRHSKTIMAISILASIIFLTVKV